jgi:hypothetical protein
MVSAFATADAGKLTVVVPLIVKLPIIASVVLPTLMIWEPEVGAAVSITVMWHPLPVAGGNIAVCPAASLKMIYLPSCNDLARLLLPAGNTTLPGLSLSRRISASYQVIQPKFWVVFPVHTRRLDPFAARVSAVANAAPPSVWNVTTFPLRLQKINTVPRRISLDVGNRTLTAPAGFRKNIDVMLSGRLAGVPSNT